MSKKKIKLLLSILILTIMHNAYAETAVWKNSPIKIKIKNGTERRIELPSAIVADGIDVTTNFHDKTEQFYRANNNFLLIKAKDTFSDERTLITSITGDVFILDISSVEDDVPNDTFSIVEDPNNNITSNNTAVIPDNIANNNQFTVTPQNTTPQGLPAFLQKNMQATTISSSENTTKEEITYVDMARFAFAHFTGPKRFIPNIPASKVGASKPKNKWLRLSPYIQTKVVASWIIDSKHVTAIHVRNIGNSPYQFDPRALRGQFEFSAALHSLIQPKHAIGNESMWVVISNLPFAQAAGRE